MIEYELGELLNMVKERYGYDIDLLEEEREKNKELVEEGQLPTANCKSSIAGACNP